MAEAHPGRYTTKAGVFLIGMQLPDGAQVPAPFGDSATSP